MIVVLTGLAACAAPVATPTDRVPGGAAWAAPGEAVTGSDLLLPGATRATLRGDFRRLDKDMHRSIRKTYWGVLSVTFDGAAACDKAGTSAVVSLAEGAKLPHASARALLADGRTARIFAWPEDENRIAVVIRVGPFGDASRERDFLATMQRVLDGKPMPVRGGTFELP